jgi:glycosyltransferase involved in cell wall biosynthesis
MPIIEGQSVGRVVITSNIPPMNEVAGQGAVLINPYNILELKKAYRKVIENKIFRESVIHEGLKNVKNYTPNKVASSYEELYKSM